MRHVHYKNYLVHYRHLTVLGSVKGDGAPHARRSDIPW
jgi:hypothetical protein